MEEILNMIEEQLLDAYPGASLEWVSIMCFSDRLTDIWSQGKVRIQWSAGV